MSPNRNDPSGRTAFEHLVAAFRHIVAAISVLDASSRDIVTARRPLQIFWHGLVGQQRKMSARAVLSAPLLAVVIAPLVAITLGYSQIEQWVLGNTHSLGQWVLGTWTGTGPRPIAIIGIVVVVAFAAAFAAKNSGLVPTILLVMGPVFGIGLARYGMMIEHFSPSKLHRGFGATAMHFETVGPVEALGTALFLALVWGIPIGTIGYTLGRLSRRVSGLLGRRGNGTGASGT